MTFKSKFLSLTAEISRNFLQKAAVCGLTTPDSAAIDFFTVTRKMDATIYCGLADRITQFTDFY